MEDMPVAFGLQNAPAAEHRMAFHRAAEVGDINRLRAILRLKKVMIDDLDASGNTALHKAAWHGHILACRFLVKNGAKVQLGNRHGKTALHFAVQRCHQDCAQFLQDIVHLPDPAEVKRKFRKNVKTSNCAKVFGPRTSQRATAMLIPGVPESQLRDDLCSADTESTPYSDAAVWNLHGHAKRHDVPPLPLAQGMSGLSIKPKIQIAGFSDVSEDAFHSGKSTARADDGLDLWKGDRVELAGHSRQQSGLGDDMSERPALMMQGFSDGHSPQRVMMHASPRPALHQEYGYHPSSRIGDAGSRQQGMQQDVARYPRVEFHSPRVDLNACRPGEEFAPRRLPGMAFV